MKIILNKKIDLLGNQGDVIIVKDGFARNYLIPKGLAIMATKNNIEMITRKIEIKNKKDAKTRQNMEALTNQLNKLSLKFELEAGEDERLFGSVTSRMISESISEKGYSVDKKEIILERSSILSCISFLLKSINLYFNLISSG